MADSSPSLRIGGFGSLLGSSVASSIGGAVSSVSVNWLVYHYTGSTLDVAYVGLTGILPGIALGLFAGVLADRYDRRRIMITADLVRFVVMAVLAASLFFVGFSLLLVLGAMTLVYSFSALFTPASQAILPRIVPTGQLEGANGLLSALTQTGYTVGAGAAGLVIVFAGAVTGFGINAATYALSAIFLFQIATSYGRPIAEAGVAVRSFRREFGEGVQYMRAHRPVLEATFGFLPANFLLTMVISFFVVYAATVYGGDVAAYGYIVAALAAGAVFGALAVPRMRARRFAGLLMGAGVLAQGGTVILLYVGRSLPVSLAGALGAGITIGLINTVYYSTMQAIVPNEILARVLSIDSVGAFVAIPAGLIVGGLLASSHGILFVYAVAAVGLLGNGVVLLALPGLRSLRYNAGPVP
ncbi:MAG: MFS transporter [Thermoplasmata archaeon]|nr:MFS transporter [Thermoplasmata archaeon]